MKKTIGVLLAVFFAVGMAHAGEQVFIQAPNNPGIPAGSCQAISEIILGLSGNVTLRGGDTGQFNLPVGISLCKDLDFFIGNSNARLNVGAGPSGGPNGDGRYGPMELFYTITSGIGTGVYVRVQGAIGSQSVSMQIIGPTTNVIWMGGGDKKLALRLRLFDRALWDSQNVKFPAAAGAKSGWLFLDKNGDGAITTASNPKDVPMSIQNASDKNDGNAICIQTPANWTDIITASFESQDALNPGNLKWDFTNDPGFEAGDATIPVAVILSATAFECVPVCGKADEWGYVPIAAVTQGSASCTFNHWSGNVPNRFGYCPGFPGNRFAIKKSGNFSPGDYELEVTVQGDGTYFGCSGGGVWGFAIGTPNDTMCTVSTTSAAAIAASVVDNTYPYLQTGPIAACAADADCEVDVPNRVVKFVYDLSAINTVANLLVQFPVLFYTLADVDPGDEVEVTFNLIKKPCGSIFTCTEKIAEYVTQCAVAPGACDPFTLPYFPPINDAVWWSGGALSNCSSMGATCTLSFYESDGDWGTYTQTLGAWGQWSGLWTSISANIVPDAGNAGTIGDATFFVCICCSPGNNAPAGSTAGGAVSALGMMGTGDQSHGYDVNTW
jgi:hypothetical protein